MGSSAKMMRGIVDQGAGDGGALLLAAGELAGPVLGAVGQVHGFEGGHGARRRSLAEMPL